MKNQYMKTMKLKYVWIAALSLGLVACSDDDSSSSGSEPLPPLTAGNADFSKYVAVGSSFTAGFTDNALFVAGQQNSFTNMLSQRFALLGGGSFTQPLMNDNIGGFLFGGSPMLDPQGNDLFGPRLFFDGEGPTPLPATQTTEATTNIYAQGPFNNMGVPGARSFHLLAAGYGTANPYFGRFASAPTASVIGDAVAQNPTFFTLSEVGGNDVLGYATNGGDATLSTITDQATFDGAFNALVDALTANGAKGVVTNVPYITSLPHFTTVPHNPLEPSNPDFGPQIPMLNTIFGALNQVYMALNAPERAIIFSETEASAVVIRDESLADMSAQIAGALNASPTFPAFIAQFGLPPQAAPLVANLLGQTYGQTRQATEDDLLVLPSSSVIGTVNMANVAALMGQGLPQALAGQFSVEGITLPLVDKWVLIPTEQQEIMAATDGFNATIESVAAANGLALVNFKELLLEASNGGISDGDFVLNTNLVTGGLVGLDGIHLTARGYAALANQFLIAIDATYGSNFEASGNLVNSGAYPTNYPPTLQ